MPCNEKGSPLAPIPLASDPRYSERRIVGDKGRSSISIHTGTQGPLVGRGAGTSTGVKNSGASCAAIYSIATKAQQTRARPQKQRDFEPMPCSISVAFCRTVSHFCRTYQLGIGTHSKLLFSVRTCLRTICLRTGFLLVKADCRLVPGTEPQRRHCRQLGWASSQKLP